MRSLGTLLLIASLGFVVPGAIADEAEDTVFDGRIEELDLGTYWYGAKIDANDLLGKVVLVEIWGS